MLTEQEKYVETAILLSEAGASKDVIIRSLVQKGADPKTAKQVTRKIIGGKQRKRLFFYILAIIMTVTLSYVVFGKIIRSDPWVSVIVAAFITLILTGLFINGVDGKGKSESGVDYNGWKNKFFRNGD